MSSDTIIAVASPPGPSSMAVLRLSGQRAVPIVEGRFRMPEGSLAGARPSSILQGDLDVEGATVPARAVVFRAPRSYTREDMVEVTIPGSPPLIARILSVFLGSSDLDVRLARPGEFTLRAFLSGRIDLTQAEAVARIIEASSFAEERAAERQLRGELRRRVEEIAAGILTAISLLEAALDFSEDDLQPVEPGSVAAMARAAASSLDDLRRSSALRLPDTGAIRAALAGLPNAGKSSLLNAFLRRPAAIVTDQEGTTRDPVRGTAPGPGGRPIEWIDLAGIEEDSLQPIHGGAGAGPPGGGSPRSGCGGGDLGRAIARRTHAELETADVVVWVVDGADPGTIETSLALCRELPAPRKIIAFSKADLVGPEVAAALRGRPEGPIVVSARSRAGLEDLAARVSEEGGSAETPQFLITARQEGAIGKARSLIGRAIAGVEGGMGFELVSVDLREALLALDELTGREIGERVLEEIFSRFCIGK